MSTAAHQYHTEVFPPAYKARLMHAARIAAVGDRIKQIDAITDEMSRLAICRRRQDLSRLGEWVAQRLHLTPAAMSA